MSLIRAAFVRIFSPSTREGEDASSLSKGEGEENSREPAKSSTEGRTGGNVQERHSPRIGADDSTYDKSSLKQGAGGRPQDSPLWERVGQQAAEVAAAWETERRSSGHTIDEQVLKNKHNMASRKGTDASEGGTASVVDASRVIREGKYDTPSNPRARLDFSEATVDLLREQAVEMKSLYERLLAQKPDVSNHSDGKENRKDLPRIEYSKMVTLSLTNFDEYKVSIYNLGYSRKWPVKWSKPSFQDLKEEWDGEEGKDDAIRREAYLVLLNTIPASLKYLVRQVRSGDVIGIWKAIYDRFLHVTTDQVKAMVSEWNNLSMTTLHLNVDKFVSLIVSKSQALREVGEEKSDEDEASTLLKGLSTHFDWLKNNLRMKKKKPKFMELVKIAVDYAHDHKLLDDKSKGSALHTYAPSGHNTPKDFCRSFNSEKGCSRSPCPWKHEKHPNSTMQGVGKHKGKELNRDKKGKVLTAQQEKKKMQCYGCGSFDHLLPKCPKKHEYYEKKKQSNINNDNPKMSLTVSRAVGVYPVIKEKAWIVDSAASEHITTDLRDLTEVREVPLGSVSFVVGNNELMYPTHVGVVEFDKVRLLDVYFCEKCPAKLISVSRLVRKGCGVTICPSSGVFSIKWGDREIIRAILKDQLFYLDVEYSCMVVVKEGNAQSRGCSKLDQTVPLETFISRPSLGLEQGRKESGTLCTVSSSVIQEVEDSEPCDFDIETLYDYHRKAGHINFKKCLRQLKMKAGVLPTCPDCSLMKLKRGSAPSEAKTKATTPNYRLHVDCSGRKRATLSGYRYYLMVVDDYSRKRWALPMKLKSDAFSTLKNHLSMIERHNPNFKVAKIRTDGGGEFISNELKEYFKTLGIQREASSPHCQYQNGVAERSIGIIDGSAKAMMSAASSPTYDWFFATQYATFLINYATYGIDSRAYTPNSLYEGVDRNVRFKGIFGCLAYAKVYVKGKQEPNSRRCIFLGYDEVYKAAVVRDVTGFSKSSRDYHAVDLTFDTTQFPYQHKLVPRPVVPPLDDEDLKEIQAVEEQKLDASDPVADQVQDSRSDELDEKHNEANTDDQDSRRHELDEKHNETNMDDIVDPDTSSPLPDLVKIDDPDDNIPDPPPHVSNRRNPTRVGRGTSSKALENIVNQSSPLFVTMDVDPESRTQALSSPDAQLWIEAEKEEKQAMREANCKLREIFLDKKSGHDPPLQAQCFECGNFRSWCGRMNGWKACQVGCTERHINVICTKCQAAADFNSQLDQWFCGCKEQKRPVRNRTSTDRFLP